MERFQELKAKLYKERAQFRSLCLLCLWLIGCQTAAFLMFYIQRLAQSFTQPPETLALAPDEITTLSLMTWANDLLALLVMTVVVSWQDGMNQETSRPWDLIEMTREAIRKVPILKINKSHLWTFDELMRSNEVPQVLLLLDPTFKDWNDSPGTLDKSLQSTLLSSYGAGMLLGTLQHDPSHTLTQPVHRARDCWLLGACRRCVASAVEGCTNSAPPEDTWVESGRFDRDFVVRYQRLRDANENRYARRPHRHRALEIVERRPLDTQSDTGRPFNENRG
eukprot:Blabericola_migrator_1__10494@NODE_594_length_7434_cov_165_100584_g436_i0_p5_GENE_NODE_594_length_7434_cov_165_100584_g436_i0NODE_594_length_7434_cov_165_100584_g436_i0_p5_ORF_typecomplete_len279_score47_79MatE/PF01554_18/0_013LrgB/PF04172_16/0_26_NODE_594_length_7434_cov_165_100584_g436_i040434879